MGIECLRMRLTENPEVFNQISYTAFCFVVCVHVLIRTLDKHKIAVPIGVRSLQPQSKKSICQIDTPLAARHRQGLRALVI